MAYTLYDRHGKEVRHHDLQDKGPWCQHGVSKEGAFANRFGNTLNIIINPEKGKMCGMLRCRKKWI